MTMTRWPLSLVLILAGSALASPVLASDTSLHSGSLVSIDLAAHKLRLEEMGPWRGTDTKAVTRWIDFGPDTKFELVTRAKGANPQGWIGGYVESALAPSAVRPGDFATVTVERGHKSLQADTVQVVRPVGTKGAGRSNSD